MKTVTIRRGGNRKITENFKESEYFNASRGAGDSFELPEILVLAMQKIRDYFGIPITISSSYRSPEENAKLENSATNSFHTCGRALDFYFKYKNKDRIDMLANEVQNNISLGAELRAMGVNGFAFYDTFVHIDTRDWYRVYKPVVKHGGDYGTFYDGPTCNVQNSSGDDDNEKQPGLPIVKPVQNLFRNLTKQQQTYLYAGIVALVVILFIVLFKRRNISFPWMY